MTEFHVTYQLADVKVDDTNALLPKQERAIVKKFMAAIDRDIVNALNGGYYVEPNWGTTFDHRPRRALLERKP